MEKPYGEGTPVHGTGSDAPDGFDGEKSGFLGEQVTCAAAAGGKTQGAGFLEITYGVLFEPTRTMAEMAQRPPLVQALLAVTLAGLAGSVAFSLALYRLAGGLEGSGAFTRAFLPAGLVLGLFWSYVKWAGASALLHLAAELLGGRGTARSVLAATGFAAIPSLFLAPVQLLAGWAGHSYTAAVILILAGLAVSIWTLALLVIALRELHCISGLRALLAVFSPLLAIFLLVLSLFLASFITAVIFVPIKAPHFPAHF